MATTLTVSRKVRPSGKVTVIESTVTVHRRMNEAKATKSMFITLTDIKGVEFDIKYVFINAMEAAS